MANTENRAAKLPRNWRTYSTDQLLRLSDELQEAGSWPEFEDVEGELDLRDAEADLYHSSSPSLEDSGYSLGSYAS